jgi:hypothetical protein
MHEAGSTLMQKLDDFNVIQKYGLPNGSFEIAVQSIHAESCINQNFGYYIIMPHTPR